jgi:hypothetical protein
MGEIHDTIESDGKRHALRAGMDRREVEAAAAYMADEDNGIGFLYSGWCQAALPHRRLPDDADWQIQTDRLTMIVEPGRKPGPGGKTIMAGVPYGSRARLIMLYLQSEALRTQSRDVALGKSMREWLTRMGIPQGGKSIGGVREQAERISRCRLSFHVTAAGRAGLVNQNIVDSAIFLESDGSQESLFVDTARLSEGFYAQLQKHPVPLEEAAIRAINNNSMALDTYAWMAYRLHVLNAPTPISWKALKAQFGGGFVAMKNFRVTFLESLRLSLAVYRDAKVDVEERGLVLHPSRPPVAPRQITAGKVPALHTPASKVPTLQFAASSDVIVSLRGRQR